MLGMLTSPQRPGPARFCCAPPTIVTGMSQNRGNLATAVLSLFFLFFGKLLDSETLRKARGQHSLWHV